MKERTKLLILRRRKNDLFFKKLNAGEQYWRFYFKNKFIREKVTSQSSLFPMYFGKWKRNIKKYDKIILFDNGYDKTVSKYIRTKNKHAKIIFWYWNSLIQYKNQVVTAEEIDEIWTYNRFDAEKFHLKYNPQFYSSKIKLPKHVIQDDIIFLGRDKGRLEAIHEFKSKLENMGLKCNFKIIQKEKEYIKYKKYLKMVSKARCILDFSIATYCGLSLRPLEALFFKKKLITNNKDIIHYDFYRHNNIFVLGIDDENKIKEFLEAPYEEVSQEIIDYYDFEAWKSRFN